MDSETIVEIADALKEALGPAFEHVYEAALRSVIAGAVLDLVLGTVLLVGSGVVIYMCVRHYKNRTDRRYVDDYMGAFFLIVPVMFGMACIYSGVHDLIATHWATIEKIVSSI